MQSFPKRLLLSNRAWVANRLELRTRYFQTLSQGQSPQALWIGCADSRVPAEEITGARPGELFVHRNIANVVHNHDHGMESILYYSLLVLKVRHIILCGHTRCGGVMAAIDGVDQPDLHKWLAPVRDALPAHSLKARLAHSRDETITDVVKTNVIRGVHTLRAHPIVRAAFENQSLNGIQGWVYSLETGVIDPVFSATQASEGLISEREELHIQLMDT